MIRHNIHAHTPGFSIFVSTATKNFDMEDITSKMKLKRMRKRNKTKQNKIQNSKFKIQTPSKLLIHS